MKFTVSTNDLRMFISLIWYIENLKNNNTHYLYTSECIHYDQEDKKILDFVVYDTDFTFNYKSEEIAFKRTRFGKPHFINSRCESGSYEEITLELINSKLSTSECIELMKNFFINCKKKYEDNKRSKKHEEKLILWSYADGYWEDIKRINKRCFDSVILDQEIKSDIKTAVERYNNKDHKNKLKSFGINHKMNFIFSGLPGTGKSSLMFSIATLLNKDIATIDFNNKDLSDHLFIKALNRIPDECLFVLEDIDALYVDRDKTRDNTISFSCILNFLDGVYSREDLVTIITTNHLERLDKAIIRPMRIDKIIKFTYCSKYQYTIIFQKFFGEDKKEIMDSVYKIIKSKKFTTSMLQNWFIKFLYDVHELPNNVKYFDELIDVSSDTDFKMYS